MSKFMKITGIALALVAVLALIGATTILAQGPPTNNGRMNQGQNQPNTGLHVMAVDETIMHEAIANALGISVTELEAALDAGQTPALLAQELGVDFTDVLAAMDAVHIAALQQAVADGLITQEQADWILSHRGGANGQANGQGMGIQGQGFRGGGMNGRMGNGAGQGQGFGNQAGNNGVCPYATP